MAETKEEPAALPEVKEEVKEAVVKETNSDKKPKGSPAKVKMQEVYVDAREPVINVQDKER